MENKSRQEWPGTYEAFVQAMRDGSVPSGSVPPAEVVASTSLEYPEPAHLAFFALYFIWSRRLRRLGVSVRHKLEHHDKRDGSS